jgi:UDP-GlcNAc3NAcA epimerase
MRIVTVVGARPQFVKAAPVGRALRAAGHEQVLVHTGQHYDRRMSQIFFDELGLPQPDVNLEIGSGPHGQQTGQMLAGIERVLLERQPQWVLVYGDTNSTLAGALAAAKTGIAVAHVEAGLRSFNRAMPEEHNRVLTDHCSDLLLCPTRTAVELLAREGITRGVELVGDTMYDAVLQFASLAMCRSTALADLGLESKRFLLATIHRPYNTDDPNTLRQIVEAFGALGERVVLPVHPRTRARLTALDLTIPGNVVLTDPVGYLDMLMLEQHARLVLTDSGGVQKEAFYFGVPCVTLRSETEWLETVDAGWNVLVRPDSAELLEVCTTHRWPTGTPPALFGDGHASEKIAELIGRPAAV